VLEHMNLLLRRSLALPAALLLSLPGLSAEAHAHLGVAIVVHDNVALRAAPRASARPNAFLWAGETVEVRGERLDHFLVYDYRRERGGFVHASQVRRLSLAASEEPDLLSVVRLLRGQPGKEALGIGYAAAFIETASAQTLNGELGIEALDALGTMAERLAQRASAGVPKAAQPALGAHLEVAARHGVRFLIYEHGGRLQVCYDGAAFRRVLALRSNPEQRVRAALALTRPECMSGELSALERRKLDQWRGEVHDMADETALLAWLRNRVLLRRAIIWASSEGRQEATTRSRPACLPL
jgi:hypothetical protein